MEVYIIQSDDSEIREGFVDKDKAHDRYLELVRLEAERHDAEVKAHRGELYPSVRRERLFSLISAQVKE